MNAIKGSSVYEHAAYIAGNNGKKDVAETFALIAQGYDIVEKEQEAAKNYCPMVVAAKYIVLIAGSIAIWAITRAICLYFFN